VIDNYGIRREKFITLSLRWLPIIKGRINNKKAHKVKTLWAFLLFVSDARNSEKKGWIKLKSCGYI
jgi:hypothetical protein